MLTKLAKHVLKSVRDLNEQKIGAGVLEFRLIRAMDQIELTGLIFHDTDH